MLRRPVSFVSQKAILWKSPMGFDHQPIARDLREDRGRSNRHAQAVTFNHHPLLDGDIGEPNGIEDEKIGGRTNLEEGLFHRSASPRLALEDLVRRQWHEVKLRAGRHFVRCRGGGRGILFDFAFREIFALGDPRHLALLRSQVI